MFVKLFLCALTVLTVLTGFDVLSQRHI